MDLGQSRYEDDRLMNFESGISDLNPAQEKLEWDAPQISLLDAGKTDSKLFASNEGYQPGRGRMLDIVGPS